MLIYVAGPITNLDSYARELNIRRAEADMRRLLNRGYQAYCTHVYARLFVGGDWELLMIELGSELLSRSDAMWLCDGWERSAGTVLEIKLAMRRGIPMYDNFLHLKEGRPLDPADLLGRVSI